MYRWMIALGAGVVVLAAVSDWGHPAGDTAQAEDAGAARAVRALVGGDTAAAVRALPGDYAAMMGYRPQTGPDGDRRILLRTDGGCTSPFGGTGYGFTPACRQHDLGYDLLRYAERRHAPLGPWARHALDANFARTMKATCPAGIGAVPCRLTADGYGAAVAVNSWRQGFGVPVVEKARSVAPGAAGGLAAALAVGFLPGLLPGASARTVARRCARRSGGGGRGGSGGGGRGCSGGGSGGGGGAPVSALATAPATAAGRLLSPARLVTAAVLLALAVQPSLLPHPWPILGAVSGAAALNGYAVAAFVEWLLRPFSAAWTPAGPTTAWAAAAGVLPLLAALVARPGSRAVALGTGMPAPGWWTGLLAVLLAELIAVAGILLVTGIARLLRVLVHVSQRVRLSAVLLAPAVLGSAFLTPAHGAPVSSTLGAHGREFLAGAITVPGGTAPVRVYVPKGGSPADRGTAAVDGLAARGGFDRRYLLVALPTGSGWVNQDAVAGLERTTHGDVATVAVQYASVPSWLAYVRGGEGARQTARAVLDAVRARIGRLPAGHRPKLLAYGESLGAWAGTHAYPGAPGARADAALWVGLPGSGRDDTRVDGCTVTTANADDPVPFWSPRLIVRPEPGMPGRWLPMATFWQVTADTVAATLTPAGHGHRYGSLAGDWRELT